MFNTISTPYILLPRLSLAGPLAACLAYAPGIIHVISTTSGVLAMLIRSAKNLKKVTLIHLPLRTID